MQNTSRLGAFGIALIAYTLAACGGGSAPPPQAPPTETVAKGDDAGTKAETPASETAAAAPAEGASPDPAKAEGATPSKVATKPSRAPHDILTQQDTLFMLSFDDSDAKKAAEASCPKAAGKDPKKAATCIAAARAKIEADGHGFKKDKDGKLLWIVIHRNGKTIVNIHKTPIEFADETENTVSLKVTGKDTGTRPGRVPGEVTVTVPNDYQIVFTDPKFGKLVYEAKIGIVKD